MLLLGCVLEKQYRTGEVVMPALEGRAGEDDKDAGVVGVVKHQPQALDHIAEEARGG
jgi:hypothetical protein